MSIDAYRWQMSKPGAPFERVAFSAQPAAGEVVVAIAGCGVCHTDLGYYYDGVRTNCALPLTLGHEISGHVVAAGAGAEGWIGKAVIVPAVLPCGECDLCQRGLQPICRSQKMVNEFTSAACIIDDPVDSAKAGVRGVVVNVDDRSARGPIRLPQCGADATAVLLGRVEDDEAVRRGELGGRSDLWLCPGDQE